MHFSIKRYCKHWLWWHLYIQQVDYFPQWSPSSTFWCQTVLSANQWRSLWIYITINKMWLADACNGASTVFNNFKQSDGSLIHFSIVRHPPPPFKVNEKQKKSKPKMLLCESSLRQYYLSSIMIVYFRYIVYHSSKLPQSNFHIKKITQMSVWNLSQLPQPAEQLLDLLYLIFQILLLNNSVWYNSLTLISPIYSTAGEAKGTETL